MFSGYKNTSVHEDSSWHNDVAKIFLEVILAIFFREVLQSFTKCNCRLKMIRFE